VDDEEASMDRDVELGRAGINEDLLGPPPAHVHRTLADVDRGDRAPAAKPAEQPPGPVRTRLYRNGVVAEEGFPPQRISDYLDEGSEAVVWLDLCSPTPHQLELLRSEFGLHSLAIEDALDETQRTKLDRYRTHLFLSAHSAVLEENTGRLLSHEIAVFITPCALITVRKDPGFDIEPVVALWDASADLAHFGVSFLLWGLLDHLVDGHFHAVESLDEAVELAEDQLFSSSRHAVERVQRRSFELRKSLVLLRRVTLPMREVVNSLLRQDLGVVPEPMAPYYHDVYDHVIRASEWTESLRDLITTIVETNLTLQGNRMNLIMKKVTSWAAIIAVPTAITGWYGQNLPYPGVETRWGFWLSSILIVGGATGLYFLFKRKDWL
jgi:magnesium transporter